MNEQLPLLIILCGRSGAGKTTLARKLLDLLSDEKLSMLTSTTTRKHRENDIDGEYEYVTDEAFDRLFMENAFVWSTKVKQTRYGTKRVNLTLALHSGMSLCILTPDTLQKVRGAAMETNPRARLLFFYMEVLNEEILRTRLTNRDGAEVAMTRLSNDADWPTQILKSGIEGLHVVRAEHGVDTIAESIAATIQELYKS